VTNPEPKFQSVKATKLLSTAVSSTAVSFAATVCRAIFWDADATINLRQRHQQVAKVSVGVDWQ
jgi:hypothetical protein